MPFPFRRHPIFEMPFDAAVANDLGREFREQSLGRRASILRKVVQRELLLRVTGQARHRVEHVPENVSSMLWIYTWSTVGDSLMDLAVRGHLPVQLQIDLLIAPTLAPLYKTDPRFRRVLTRPEDVRDKPDFVLLQDLTTASIALKQHCAKTAPFASVFEHLRGERFDRLGFAQRRMEQLFGLSVADPARPSLHLANDGPVPFDATCVNIAVGLGARDPRRRYRHWPVVLETLVAHWPERLPPPRFALLGSANALDDLAAFPAEFIERHCHVAVDRLDLSGTATMIQSCDAFLGTDGGLMHLAVALEKPGLALFVEIDPHMRLLRGSPMQSLFTPSTLDHLAPLEVATVLLDMLPNALR